MAARAYAQRTRVPADRSRIELEALLRKAGAHDIAQMVNDDRAMIAFRLVDRCYRFTVPLYDGPAAERTRNGFKVASAATMSPRQAQQARQRWRALLLVIRAKLESARAGITSLDVELMPYCVLPGGRTVADEALPRIASAYASGQDVPLLPGA